ncbi:MAG: diguanylate cyclase [Steroidobacteraceae bacterium]
MNYRIVLGSTALIAIVMLAIVVIPQTLSRSARLEVMRERVGEVSRLAASVIDGDLHRRLVEEPPAPPELRAAALAPLLKLHRAWPAAKYLYTMGVRDSQPFFVLDTAQDSAFASERALRPSQYLEPFTLRQEYASNWLDELAEGRTFVNPQFQMDDYGSFMTGHAPILDSNGKVAGFVGVDFTTDYEIAEESRFRHIEAASIAGALLLSLVLGVVYARHHANQQAELLLHYESAMRDSLTGLLNRRGANAAILAAVSNSTSDADTRTHACLLVDIDLFKTINDTRGHAEGDAVIRRLAGVLRSGLRDGDVTARLGGDEFLVFLPDCEIDAAERIAAQLLGAVREESRGSSSPFEVTVGVGVARATEGGFDLLYHRADHALYEAKASGRNRYAVYSAA